MTLIRKNENVFPSMWNEMFDTEWMPFGKEKGNFLSSPAVNIKEEEQRFCIELAMPGIKKEDLNIDIEDKKLIIYAERKSETNEEKEGKYSRREFNYSSFKRSFTMPENVNIEAIKAQYEDGVLKIDLPKVEESISKLKKIEIQ